jgi:transposase
MRLREAPGIGRTACIRSSVPQQLAQWRTSGTHALAEPEEARASPQQTKHDRRRIKELERKVRRKNRALAETAALLVLSRKLEAAFNNWDKGEAE